MHYAATQVARADSAEQQGNVRASADHLTLAIVATTNYPLRDSLMGRLLRLVRAGAWGEHDSVYADSAVERALDSAFQIVYDRAIPVTRYVRRASTGQDSTLTTSASSKVVLGEYLTGVQCSFCWLSDRAFSALSRRYTSNDFIFVGYHDGPGYPLAARNFDSLWAYIGSEGTQPQTAVYAVPIEDGVRDLASHEWVDGKSLHAIAKGLAMTQSGEASSIPLGVYNYLASLIDERLSLRPGAAIELSAEPELRDTAGNPSTIRVQARIGPTERGRRIGVRFVLVEDTVRVTGLTNRRLHYMVARAVSWFEPRQMFFELPRKGIEPANVTYLFDVDTVQHALFDTYAHDEEGRSNFPSVAAWTINRGRLGVVVIVQDLDSREVLQSSYQRISRAASKERKE